MLWIIPSCLFSLDLELIGGVGNLAFDKTGTSALSLKEGAFTPHYFPLIKAGISGEYQNLQYNAGFSRDPFMGNRLSANIKASFDYFSVGAGPFIGLFNSEKHPISMGISAMFEVEVPGIIFLNAGASSTLGQVMELTGGYSQYSGDISLGFWVPYVICSLNYSIKNFTQKPEGNLYIEDDSVRYFFRADVFTKNVPYTMRVDLGFQTLSRSYTSRVISDTDIEMDTEQDVFRLFFVGLEASYRLNEKLRFLLGAEFPVYYWGVSPLKSPPKGTVLFETRLGVVWSLTSSE